MNRATISEKRKAPMYSKLKASSADKKITQQRYAHGIATTEQKKTTLWKQTGKQKREG